MSATAWSVWMPANYSGQRSAALQNHGIWKSAIGYDPYAPDQKAARTWQVDEVRGAPAGGTSASAPEGGMTEEQQNAYDSFQRLLALARLTRSSFDEVRGACKKCGSVGHLTFQCRNFLTAKEEAAAAAAAVLDKERSLKEKGSDVSDIASDKSESDLSDSDEYPKMEGIFTVKYELADIPVPRPRFDHPSILVILFLYLFGYVERSGTKTYNSGSLDFRDIYVSLLLFKGSYVWIKFRDVAIKKIERPRKDGTATVRYEGRFKPTKEKRYFHVGTYENEEDAKAACKIAQFYFGQMFEGQKSGGTVDLQGGCSFNIPSMTECERLTLSSALSSVSGEAASKVRRDWIKSQTAKVFEMYKTECRVRSLMRELELIVQEGHQRGKTRPGLQERQPGAGCDNIEEERRQYRATLQQLERELGQRNWEYSELEREYMELRRENMEFCRRMSALKQQGLEK